MEYVHIALNLHFLSRNTVDVTICIQWLIDAVDIFCRGIFLPFGWFFVQTKMIFFSGEFGAEGNDSVTPPLLPPSQP